jgi:hypothetical protein
MIKKLKPLKAITMLCFALSLISSTHKIACAQWSSSGGNTTTTDKVGIGTTGAPAQALDVNGVVNVNTAVQIAKSGSDTVGSGPYMSLFNSFSPSVGWLFQLSGSNYFDLWHYNGTWNRRLTFDTSGNMGLGTTSPGTVGGDGGTYTAFNVHNNNAGGYGLLTLSGAGNSSGNGGGVISFGSTAAASGDKRFAAIQGLSDGSSASSTNGALLFYTNGAGNLAEAMRITKGGAVGIGTTNPGSVGGDGGIYTAFNVHNNNAGGYGLLTLSGAGNSNGNGGGVISFGSTAAASGDKRFAAIQGLSDGSSAGSTNGALVFYTNGAGNIAEAVRINKSGAVGIGTPSPSVNLEVYKGSASNTIRVTADSGNNAYVSLNQTGVRNWSIYNAASSGDLGFNDGAGTWLLIQKATGNVGIGTGTSGASEKLEINGNLKLTGTGNIVASGTINAKYQDVAEWVPASEQLSAGTVVVLDATKANQVTSSTTSYDTRVAGVVSEQPGIALGEKSEGKVLVATTGRVRVRVDATKGPIHIGDLLVTSDESGMAMKSEPITIGARRFHEPGTLIGKALESLEKGKGSILVLLSLQ